MSGGEKELESFRQQWRDEVSRRHNHSASGVSRRAAGTAKRDQKARAPQPTLHHHHADAGDETFSPRSFDLEDKEHLLKLGSENRPKPPKEPQSALEHYEKAVEQESAGRMGDSVSLYRKAFKLDSRVHEIYKQKHSPPSSSAHTQSSASSSTTTAAVKPTQTPAAVPDAVGASITELMQQFSQLSIPPAEPETNLSPAPPCPIASVPEEIISQILEACAVRDIGSFARIAQVCKRFAYLTSTEDPIWKRVTLGHQVGFAAMHYRYVCNVMGEPFVEYELGTGFSKHLTPAPILDLTPSVYPTYRSQFRHRPRLRFNGCYISTVNYTRPGASHQSHYNWNSPILIVTYYRYLRFFRDGTVISLTTTSEPSDVVHHLKKENLHIQHTTALPSSVMIDALPGRWRLSGPASADPDDDLDTEHSPKGPGEYAKEPPAEWLATPEEEQEGDIHLETLGVSPKYLYKAHMSFGNAGRKDGTRNNKLNWKGFWSYNKLTDDWAEFSLKHYRPFYFSRVKSYGTGM